MAIETELKARVNDPEKVRAALSNEGDFCYSFLKKDTYWTFPKKTRGKVRIRNQEKIYPNGETCNSILVTYKTRELHGEIEVNNEQEFTISNSDAFENILSYLGLTRSIYKEKQGWAWNISDTDSNTLLLAELSQVKNLGWFIELELMSESRDEQLLEQNCSRLLRLLEKLEIPRESIESRPYTELVKLEQCALI